MKRKFCQLVIACAGILVSALLFGLSFEAVISISGSWLPADYWLMWFSVFSFLAALVSGVFGIAWSVMFFGDLCEGRKV
jgi:hypothetical protein